MSYLSRRRFLALGAAALALVACGAATPGAPPAATPEPTATAVPAATAEPTPVADPEPEATGKPAEAVIRYTDGGFVPDEVQVRVGGTVHFRNESARQMWIASNPHPAHTDYPEFDSRRGLGNGETYSFTFTREGKWGFHNHLQPGDGGEVEVE